MSDEEREETSQIRVTDKHSGPGASWRDGRLARFLRNGKFVSGLLLAVFIALALAIGPVIYGPDPITNDLRNRLQSPGRLHLFGTDHLGRDVLARVLRGGQVSLLVSLGAMLIGGVVGVLVGLISGYFGGLVDELLMRIVDLQLAFPFILLALLLLMVLGTGAAGVIVVLATTNWVYYVRTVRGQVLSIRERVFVLAARSIGAGDSRIIVKHILPQVVTSILVISVIRVGSTLIIEGALGFLGVGLQPPLPSLGRDLNEARRYLAIAWWVGFFPGMAIFLFVAAANLIGEGLREISRPDTFV